MMRKRPAAVLVPSARPKLRSQSTHRTLKAWRLSSRLNQAEAAQLLGVSQGFYSKIEAGKGWPHAKLAQKISARVGVPVVTLLGLS
jgi:transcriptional regulator with XRE-family HTH domain